jgi:mannose-1-phosphate guanylyltransferase
LEAIILAGGFGTRLRPLTYTRAKSLLPILNKPMISYLIDSLPSVVNKVILAVNYRKNQIEEFLNSMDYGREIIVNDEPKPLGTGGAVKFAEQHITAPFFVLNADIISSLDPAKMIAFHKKHKAQATISLWPVENVTEFGVVDIKNDGNVIGFVEKPKSQDAPSDLINAGAYLLQPEILDYIETQRLVSMEKEIFPQIINDTGRFYGYQFPGYWIDVGRLQSYIDVHILLMKQQQKPSIAGRNTNNNGILQSTCLGNEVNIGENSALKSVIVLDKTKIGRNSQLVNCIIGSNCNIGDGVHLENVVVGDNEQINDNTSIQKTTIWTQSIPEGYPQKQIGNVIGE